MSFADYEGEAEPLELANVTLDALRPSAFEREPRAPREAVARAERDPLAIRDALAATPGLSPLQIAYCLDVRNDLALLKRGIAAHRARTRAAAPAPITDAQRAAKRDSVRRYRARQREKITTDDATAFRGAIAV